MDELSQHPQTSESTSGTDIQRQELQEGDGDAAVSENMTNAASHPCQSVNHSPGLSRLNHISDSENENCNPHPAVPEPRSVKALYCTDKLWVFVTPGVTLIVIGFLLCFIYFSIRGLTTSLEYTETIPTYANAILVLCAGILTISICKRRNKVLIVTMITMCAICCLLSTASGILTGIRNIQMIHSIAFCQYRTENTQCHCYTYIPSYKPRNRTSWAIIDPPEFVFYQSPSCEVITTNLVDFMYTQCALYGGTVIMCCLAICLGAVVYRNELRRAKLHEAYQQDYSMCTVVANRCAETSGGRGDEPIPDDATDHLSGNTSSLFSQRITFPGENQPRLLGIRRNDSIVGRSRSDEENQNHNHYTSLPNLTSRNANDHQREMSATHGQPSEAYGQRSEVQANMENESRDRNCNQRSSAGRTERMSNASQTLDPRQLSAMWGMFVRYLQQMGHSVGGDNGLPDNPLHRGAAAETLPNRPMTRNSNNQSELPPWPVSRQSSCQNLPHGPLSRSGHQNLGHIRTRSSRNTVTSQRNSSLRDPRIPVSNRSFVHYLTGVSSLVTYQVEPPPPYAQPPPYLENDTVPEYTSNTSAQTDQDVSSAQNSLSLNECSEDVIETVI